MWLFLKFFPLIYVSWHYTEGNCLNKLPSQQNASLESFCAYLQNWLKINSKHSISLEGFQTVWKYIGQCEKFPEGVESFHTAWKIFGQSGEFLNTLESFWRVWKVSRQSRNFPDSLKNFLDSLEKAWTVWKVSGKPGKFLDNLEGLQPICKRQRYVITWTKSLKLTTNKVCQKIINNDFWRFCRESESRTFGIYVAETIYALRPESFCPRRSADRKF